MSLLISKMKVY